jgi:hypothetical protein
MVAPARTAARRVSGREEEVWTPPSEKESGVMLTMAMTWVFRVGVRAVMVLAAETEGAEQMGVRGERGLGFGGSSWR